MRLAFHQTHLYRLVNMEVTPGFEPGNEGFAENLQLKYPAISWVKTADAGAGENHHPPLYIALLSEDRYVPFASAERTDLLHFANRALQRYVGADMVLRIYRKPN